MTTKKPAIKKTPTETPKDKSVAEPTIKQDVSDGLAQEDQVPAKKRKHGKSKVIRDSFSFPEVDYLKILDLKKACLKEGIHVKKSELLRAGLQLLTTLSPDNLKLAVEQIEKIKTGRPNS